MLGSLHLLRWARRSWRWPVTAALLALQVIVAVSSVIERRPPDRPIAHVHDQETRHLFAHDESNCGLCAARTQVADVPATATLITTDIASAQAILADGAANLPPAPRAANPSRAPPALT